jgi:hypothetical protein
MAPRSTGCANCRKRKIKCDEGRPGCRKCQIHNSACPGYRGLKADGLEWRDETQAVVRRVERARKRSGSLSNISNDSGSSPRDLSNSLGSSNNGGSIVVDSSVDVVGGGGDDHGTNNSNRNFAPPTKGVKELSLADKEKQYHQQAPPPPPGAITKPNNDTAAAANPVTTRRKTSTKKPSTAKQNSVIIPQAIFSAATNRSQMFDVSMRLYRPATLDEQPLRAHISDFSCLQKTITAKSSPALLAAVDTISLLQLGVSYQDDMFFEQARRRYGQALACLVVALNKPDVLGNNDVLGAMKLLEFCEVGFFFSFLFLFLFLLFFFFFSFYFSFLFLFLFFFFCFLFILLLPLHSSPSSLFFSFHFEKAPTRSQKDTHADASFLFSSLLVVPPGGSSR